MIIRHAETSDLPSLVDIRNYYILNSYALFDNRPETVQERLPWFEKYQKQGSHRLLVAVDNGKVLGCAYSSKYRDGEYFSKTVETSIYVAPAMNAKGIGSKLYQELFDIVSREDVHCAVAGIALPNDASVKLHEKCGFKKIGVFAEYALKNGNFISSLWMQRMLQ